MVPGWPSLCCSLSGSDRSLSTASFLTRTARRGLAFTDISKIIWGCELVHRYFRYASVNVPACCTATKRGLLMHPGLCLRKIAPTIDVVCTAKKLIQTHGPDAALVAERWAECALRSGDRQRSAAWRAVLRCVARRRSTTAELDHRDIDDRAG